VIGYDSVQKVRNEERSVEQKTLVRKAEPPSKRGMAWPRWTGFRNKTVWDYLQLLIVPLMLVAIGFWFTGQQDARQQDIENQRAKAERELAVQRAQDEALQAYLNQMSSLLLEKDLRESEEDSEVRTLALARTLTVLGRLDPSHKLAVMEFLVEADLVQRVEGRGPIIRLQSADLRGANLSDPDEVSPGCGLSCYDPEQVVNLRGADLAFANLTNAQLYRADLRDANLSGAFLEDANLEGANLLGTNLSGAFLKDAGLLGANLSGADLHGADSSDPWSVANLRSADLSGFGQVANLSGADLSDLNLSDANLEEADLSDANLSDANLSDAFLLGANLSGANLRGANLRGASLRDAGLLGANLNDAFLRGANLRDARPEYANLSGADLSGADLSEADLSEADLSSADLSEANLSYADLSHAKGMSNEELEQETSLLGRATMPDGQRHKSVTTEFVTTEFEPALSYNISESWAATTEMTGELSLTLFRGPEKGELIFTSPSHVFDPSRLSEATKVSAPENAKEWLSWFQRHPNLKTSKPVPVSVGGASGMQIDVTASSTLEDYPRKICGPTPCVPLYPTSGNPIFAAPSGTGKDRYVIVDVGGETVVINVTAPPGDFDAFSPKAQKVLDSLEWKSG
jgi:uncharacterized protein YjbI with pentapeptide repeats